jgi:hypothetical protein
VAQLRHRQPELDAVGARVVLVSFETLARTRAHVRYHKLPYPTLIDERRALYRAFGMDRGPWWRIYGPRVLWRYLLAYLRGGRLRIRGDTFQRGGDVLVDSGGVISLVHVGVDSFDRPAVDDLLTQLHALPRRT